MSSNCPLLDLPLELRSTIYSLVLPDTFGPYYSLPTELHERQVSICHRAETATAVSLGLALLQVSRQVRIEVLHLLYENYTVMGTAEDLYDWLCMDAQRAGLIGGMRVFRNVCSDERDVVLHRSRREGGLFWHLYDDSEHDYQEDGSNWYSECLREWRSLDCRLRSKHEAQGSGDEARLENMLQYLRAFI